MDRFARMPLAGKLFMSNLTSVLHLRLHGRARSMREGVRRAIESCISRALMTVDVLTKTTTSPPPVNLIQLVYYLYIHKP